MNLSVRTTKKVLILLWTAVLFWGNAATAADYPYVHLAVAQRGGVLTNELFFYQLPDIWQSPTTNGVVSTGNREWAHTLQPPTTIFQDSLARAFKTHAKIDLVLNLLSDSTRNDIQTFARLSILANTPGLATTAFRPMPQAIDQVAKEISDALAATPRTTTGPTPSSQADIASLIRGYFSNINPTLPLTAEEARSFRDMTATPADRKIAAIRGFLDLFSLELSR